MENMIFEKHTVENGQLVLNGLPFSNGEEVNVFLWKKTKYSDYPLQGKPIKFIDPTEPVSEFDWEVCN